VRLDQTRPSEHLQMVRGRRDALAGLVSERLDGPPSLGQEVEELETARTGRGLTDTRDLLIDRSFQ